MKKMGNLGKVGKDKITGFKGIIVGKANYLYGCTQYALAPRVLDKETGKLLETAWFDEGRIEIISDGITSEEVKGKKPGAEYNRDAPKI
jgi:hypothetical protein